LWAGWGIWWVLWGRLPPPSWLRPARIPGTPPSMASRPPYAPKHPPNSPPSTTPKKPRDDPELRSFRQGPPSVLRPMRGRDAPSLESLVCLAVVVWVGVRLRACGGPAGMDAGGTGARVARGKDAPGDAPQTHPHPHHQNKKMRDDTPAAPLLAHPSERSGDHSPCILIGWTYMDTDNPWGGQMSPSPSAGWSSGSGSGNCPPCHWSRRPGCPRRAAVRPPRRWACR